MHQKYRSVESLVEFMAPASRLWNNGISLSRVMRKLAQTLDYRNKISWKRRGKRTAERRIAQMQKGKKTLGSRGVGNIYIQPSKRRCLILQYIVLCCLSIRVWWVFQHELYP